MNLDDIVNKVIKQLEDECLLFQSPGSKEKAKMQGEIKKILLNAFDEIGDYWFDVMEEQAEMDAP